MWVELKSNKSKASIKVKKTVFDTKADSRGFFLPIESLMFKVLDLGKISKLTSLKSGKVYTLIRYFCVYLLSAGFINLIISYSLKNFSFLAT